MAINMFDRQIAHLICPHMPCTAAHLSLLADRSHCSNTVQPFCRSLRHRDGCIDRCDHFKGRRCGRHEPNLIVPVKQVSWPVINGKYECICVEADIVLQQSSSQFLCTAQNAVASCKAAK